MEYTIDGEDLTMSTPEEKVFEISNTYNDEQARYYFAKHKRGFWRRVSNWCEQRMVARALAMAGEPKSVLDLPCGAGRFWELLARVPDRHLMAADYSQDMINTALNFQPPHVAGRFKAFQASAFEIKLPDAAIDCVFCMRLLHHIDKEEARAKILHEFHRVSRDTVCVSLWVDGNIQSWRRRSRGRRKTRQDQTRFLFDRSQIEREFLECGFDIVGSVDLLPGFSMWRTYVLKRR
jgi:SAM-dependent methyltransferase